MRFICSLIEYEPKLAINTNTKPTICLCSEYLLNCHMDKVQVFPPLPLRERLPAGGDTSAHMHDVQVNSHCNQAIRRIPLGTMLYTWSAIWPSLRHNQKSSKQTRNTNGIFLPWLFANNFLIDKQPFWNLVYTKDGILGRWHHVFVTP